MPINVLSKDTPRGRGPEPRQAISEEKKKSQKNRISPLKKPKPSGNHKRLGRPVGQAQAATATLTRIKVTP